MQPWEITKARAQATLTVWTQHAPTMTVAGAGPADLEALIDGFEPRLQARALRRDEADAAGRAVQSSLQRMHLLGARVPRIIEAQLSEDEGIRRDLRDVYRVKLTSQNTILERARRLHPVWVRANAILAAMSPPLPPLTRPIQGVAHTAAMYLALVDSFTALTGAASDAEGRYDDALAAMDEHVRACDSLIKRWYKMAKATFDPGTPAHAALDRIPTEPTTPYPVPIEIATLVQGGEGGLHLLVSYAPGGGAHATKKVVKWQIGETEGVDGVDPVPDQSAPLEASGNTLGPFAVGQVVQVVTEVKNSAGTRTSAVRRIEIVEPIG